MPADRPKRTRTTKAAVAGGGFFAASSVIKQSSLPPSSPPPSSSPPSSPPPRALSPFLSGALCVPSPSTPREISLRKRRMMEEEQRRKALNKWVAAAKADAAAHPTDGLKAVDFRNALEDYELEFGHFVPDDKIDDYMRRRGRVLLKLDSLFQAAVKACPFVNASPLDLYHAASQQFYVDFGVPYKPTDHHHRQQKEAMITKNLEILDVYCKIHVDPEHELRLVPQRLWSYEFVNPFPLTDARQFTLHLMILLLLTVLVAVKQLVASYTGEVFEPSLTLETVRFELLNPNSRNPRGVACRRLYCKHQVLENKLKALQAEAEVQARQHYVNDLAMTSIIVKNALGFNLTLDAYLCKFHWDLSERVNERD
ncbi:hypothetical protein K438DRAFT_1790006 [Mycena galopus ATCC 62051]|nr:hypothetical protein K438DRAFT_1790006 [Mycena galopus ATCC 62051]